MRSCWRTPSKHSPTRQESHSWAGKECCSRLNLNCIHSTKLENLLDKPIGHHVLRPNSVKALSVCWSERKLLLVDRHLDPFGLWVRVWSRRWKIEASCRSENRSQRPLPPSPAALTHKLSLPRSRSFLGCTNTRGSEGSTITFAVLFKICWKHTSAAPVLVATKASVSVSPQRGRTVDCRLSCGDGWLGKEMHGNKSCGMHLV